MKKYLKAALIFTPLFILLIPLVFLVIKYKNVLPAFNVLNGNMYAYERNFRHKKDTVISQLTSDNSALSKDKEDLINKNFSLDTQMESVDITISDSYGYVNFIWNIQKPITATISKHMHDWIDGQIESVSIKGADYELTTDVQYENYGEILPKTTKFISVVKNADPKIFYGGGEIFKYCKNNICSYGNYENYTTHPTDTAGNICAGTTFNSNQLCYFSYISFANSSKEYIGDGAFTCIGEDKSQICDKMVKSLKMYQLPKSEE